MTVSSGFNTSMGPRLQAAHAKEEKNKMFRGGPTNSLAPTNTALLRGKKKQTHAKCNCQKANRVLRRERPKTRGMHIDLSNSNAACENSNATSSPR